MASIPELAHPLVQPFADSFTRPTFKRFLTLMAGAILRIANSITSRTSVRTV
jgi:hypothetical protein